MRRPEWSDIHDTTGFHIATPGLALLSGLYGLGVRIRLKAYACVNRRCLPGFVVSVGNLTVGGTGKTPAACMLAEWAMDGGYRPAILSRGYGGHYRTRVHVVSDEHGIHAGPTQAGDEPVLLARKLKGVPVILSKKRYLAGSLAAEKYKSNFFILDDGFQHLALKRDLDLVLIDAATPFGNGHLLPWGPLREPVDQLKRADALILTRSGGDPGGDGLKGMIREQLPDKAVYRADHIPEKVIFPYKKRDYGPGFLKGRRLLGFAGIARPEIFRQTLVRLGGDPVFFTGYPDHHVFTRKDLDHLVAKKAELKADYLLTTEKDWVKMENLGTEYGDLAYLTIRFSLLSDQDRFFGMIRDKMLRSQNNQ